MPGSYQSGIMRRTQVVLAPGNRIGGYEVVARSGAVGMRFARATSSSTATSLKVLHETFTTIRIASRASSANARPGRSIIRISRDTWADGVVHHVSGAT
jgi:hypothetical protein